MFFLLLGTLSAAGASGECTSVKPTSESDLQSQPLEHSNPFSFDHKYNVFDLSTSIKCGNSFERQMQNVRCNKKDESSTRFRMVQSYSRKHSDLVYQEVTYTNFTKLLTVRHHLGFYLYGLKKLII